MSKFCSNCGNQMDDQATFCPNCGAANNAAPAPQQAPAENKVAAVAGEYLGKASAAVNSYAKKAKKNPKMLIAPVVAVVVVILAIVLIANLFKYSGVDGALERYYDVMYENKPGQVKNMAPEEYWKYLEDESDVDLDDVKDFYEDEYIEDVVDNLEDEYGKNYKFSVKVTDKDEVKAKDLKKIAKTLKEAYDIDKKDVKKAYKVDYEAVVKGSEDDDDEEFEDEYVVKIGSKWYVISTNEEFSYVSFDGATMFAYGATNND